MYRVGLVLASMTIAGIFGCAKPPSPGEIANLQGGTTIVVAYGFCVPMDHLINTTLTRGEMKFVVNGKSVGTMQTCSYATFTVPSGYWEAEFKSTGLNFPRLLPPPPMKFRPGATQYLYLAPEGNGTYSYNWVTKEQADKGIAAIKKIPPQAAGARRPGVRAPRPAQVSKPSGQGTAPVSQ